MTDSEQTRLAGATMLGAGRRRLVVENCPNQGHQNLGLGHAVVVFFFFFDLVRRRNPRSEGQGDKSS